MYKINIPLPPFFQGVGQALCSPDRLLAPQIETSREESQSVDSAQTTRGKLSKVKAEIAAFKTGV